MKLNAVKFKDRTSFEKNKKKSNVAAFYDNYDVIVFKDNTYVKPDKTKVSHVEQVVKKDALIPTGFAILKTKNFYISLAACERLRLTVRREYPKFNMIIVEIPEHMTFTKFYEIVINSKDFDDVSQDTINIHKTNANFTYDQHWQLFSIDAQSAWDAIALNPPATDNIVAVFDIGCEDTHPDLLGQVVSPLDTVTGTPNVNIADPNAKHGTPCVGLVAANPNNGINTIGVAGQWTKATFCNVGVMVNSQSFSMSVQNQLDAIDHAMSFPNCVAISMSYSSPTYNSITEDAFVAAQQIGRNGKGIVCCAAAGNESTFNSVDYPANYSGVCSISALDFNDFDYTLAGYSNYGVNIFAAAPASGTPATDRTSGGYSAGDTTYFSGTSAACPVFAGAVGAIAAAVPTLTELQIKNIIAETCVRIGGYNYDGNPIYPNRSYETGYGMINLGNAVALATGGTAPPDPDIPINLRITLSTISLTFPGTSITVNYTVICNKVIPTDTVLQVKIFRSSNNNPTIEPADTILSTQNITLLANQFRVQGSYTFTVDDTWVGINYIGGNVQTLPGETYTLDNTTLKAIQVIGESPAPNLNLKARIQDILLTEDGTKAKVYFDIENTGITPVTKFTIKKGFVGYEEYVYEVAYELTTDKFYVEETFWELLPPPNFIYDTPFKIEITSVNGIFPDNVDPDNIATAYIIPAIGG
jgi:hypothetical protein